jgi:hypothetical protein
MRETSTKMNLAQRLKWPRISLASSIGCILFVCALFTSCRLQPQLFGNTPLPQRGYLWQRNWTPAVTAAVTEADRHMDGVIVLGSEIQWTGGKPTPIRAKLSWETLKTLKKSVALALRIDPYPGPFLEHNLAATSVLNEAARLIHEVHEHQLNLSELQLDFDCPQKKLAGYEIWVRLVRAAIRPVKLILTVLPVWLDEPDFADLIRESDGYVLQVHSVPTGHQIGHDVICDPALARSWVTKAAKLDRPFHVALPTYRCTAGYGPAGNLLGVAMDSVTPVFPPGTRLLEFDSDADALARLVNDWHTARPACFKGIIWYRVPVSSDRQNWRWPTMIAVMQGRTPLHRLEVSGQGDNPVDLSISNNGESDLLQSSEVLSTLLCCTFWSLVACLDSSPAFATGFFGPVQYLDNGGRNIDLSPEFYWELEVKRLSSGFHPIEKLLLVKIDESNTGDDANPNPKLAATEEADAKDFDQAVQEDRIKPPDPEKARKEHDAARELISKSDDKTTDLLPEEFDSEFADYDRGAFAYRRGKKHWDEAANAWRQLLQRPEAERHYRTVWALFMLGKIAVKSGDPEAITWFHKTRDAAKSGFADSLGMAADSYGWEGRSEWNQNHPEKAAPLFLTQLALGDTSAIVSLKALIPDRAPVDGMLNYGMEADAYNNLTPEEKSAEDQKAQVALQAAAKDPLLRSLVTAHILATESTAQNPTEGQSVPQTGPQTRCGRWLQAINDAKLAELDDAEYLGWVAYNNGNYSDAERWLKLAKTKSSPAAAWLRAKLQRRSGLMNEAAKSMESAWESVRDLSRYTGWSGTTEDRYLAGRDEYFWTFDQSASGDLGGLRLERADFVQALETFWRGGLWDDAAYIAEHVLSAGELRAFVDQQPDAAGSGDSSSPYRSLGDLKYLLGRRLVREDEYQDAARYMKPPYDKILASYVQALNDGANEQLPKEQRARAWFTAAWLARYDGLELMGTEADPDGFDSGGAFQNVDLAKQRTSGFWTLLTFENGQQKSADLPLVLKPSKQEIKRLGQYRTIPDIRFHYRVIAGALAMRAAAQLPDNTPELADVVNTAGKWVADRDEKVADRYYQQLESRCAKTIIGRSAIARHWFVDDTGPWSTEQAAKRAAMRQELGIKDE